MLISPPYGRGDKLVLLIGKQYKMLSAPALSGGGRVSPLYQPQLGMVNVTGSPSTTGQ